jgi:hypothetical protein
MTTFTTTVSQMFTLPQEAGQTDVVVNVNYLVTGVDGTYTAVIGFSQQFTIQQGEAFTPYAQLTEAQVVGWADPQTVSNMQACVQGQLDSAANPPISPTNTPLPWTTA